MEDRTASKAQFSRGLGVSKARVTQLIRAGLPVNEKGIPVKEAVRWLRENNKLPESALEFAEEVEKDDAPRTRDGLRAMLDRLDLMTTAEAEQVKQNYLALQRRLEYEQAAGEVAPIDEMVKRYADECAKVRSKLLAIPTELAPRIAQETGGNANVIREMILDGVTRALEELTGTER